MMWRIILSLTFMMWAVATGAQSVTVRSGDHPTFSRLVLSMPVGTDWTLGRLGQGYGLRLAGDDIGFDIDTVFARISRARIADLTAANGTLQIALACDCHATAFLWQPGKLVVDIVDGPPPDDRFTTMLPDATETTRQSDAAPDPTTTTAFPVVFDGPEVVPSFPPTPETSPAALSDLERALIESVARAASQGLLKPVAAAPSPVDNPTAAVAEQEAQVTGPTDDRLADRKAPDAETVDPESAIAEALRDLPGVTAQTSIDRDRPVSPPTATQLTADTCLPDSAVAVADWGDGRDFAAQIAARTAALTGEFDRIPAGAVEDLARTYIFFGFGREARQALGLDGARSQERNILAAMAALVDGDPDPQNVFANQLGCATDAAFWALLHRGAAGGETGFDSGRIRRAYLALPPTLVGHLGNRLADIFAGMGDPEAAQMILDAAASGLTTRPTESAETAAEVAVLRGDDSAAIGELTAMATDDARTTPTALLRLLTLATQAGQPVDDSLMALADALRFEYRGEPIATDLGVAQVAALLAADRFDAAATLAEDLAPAIDPGRSQALHFSYVTALTGRADDASFVRVALAGLPADIGSEAENAVAARLLSLGFPDRAAALLLAPAQFGAAAERRYLRAAAAIGMQQPDAALAALAGMSDARAAALRATALNQKGEFGAALSSDLAAGDPDRNTAGAWRAGAWKRLAGSNDPLLQATADAMLATAELTGQPPSLAAGQSALVDSAATRDLIDGLLGRFTVDPVPGGNSGL